MIAPNVNYTATEVLDWNEDLQADTQDNDFEQISSEEDNVVTETPVIIPSHSEACKAFDTCLIWAERNIHNVNDILVLKRLQEIAILRSTQHKTKQTNLLHRVEVDNCISVLIYEYAQILYIPLNGSINNYCIVIVKT
ncbi:hypothetical protein QE152_g36781 [Popillia japonica]|uniref:Uncharacterized protein n=1 Tax=Popillia japonica TaxID=7064 RepID=A0AAW1ICN9_POPJA